MEVEPTSELWQKPCLTCLRSLGTAWELSVLGWGVFLVISFWMWAINLKINGNSWRLTLNDPIFYVCQSPLFLLFLDATWQLLEQYPAAFEFSETYLAVLYDSTRISLFGTFLFNSPHQRVKQSTVSAVWREQLLGLSYSFMEVELKYS